MFCIEQNAIRRSGADVLGHVLMMLGRRRASVHPRPCVNNAGYGALTAMLRDHVVCNEGGTVASYLWVAGTQSGIMRESGQMQTATSGG